jgi:hypothetical protein
MRTQQALYADNMRSCKSRVTPLLITLRHMITISTCCSRFRGIVTNVQTAAIAQSNRVTMLWNAYGQPCNTFCCSLYANGQWETSGVIGKTTCYITREKESPNVLETVSRVNGILWSIRRHERDTSIIRRIQWLLCLITHGVCNMECKVICEGMMAHNCTALLPCS